MLWVLVLGLGLRVCIVCRDLVWLDIGMLVGGMCIEGAIMGLFVPVMCYGFCPHWLVCRIMYYCWLVMFG